MAGDFRTTQARFAAYIRDPANNPRPADVEPRRMDMYRELFFNNIHSFLSSNFPVLRAILNDRQWQELAADFFAGHPCRTPYFSEIAEEFLAYLQSRDDSADYPFLLELAHYEWVEMALSISTEHASPADAEFVAELPRRRITLSPLAWPLAYQYPVDRISPAFLPLAPPEHATYLLVYRDREDKVHFLQATAFTFRLLQILEQHPAISAAACLQALAAEAPDYDSGILIEEGLKTLREMAAKGIIIPAGDG